MVKENNSRRSFFKKAAAAVGVVAAAGYTTKTLTSASPDPVGKELARHANEDRLQEDIMRQKQYVVMTDSEKKQMLDEILNNHNNGLA
ncbi:MAG: twin-arginine translocation signal domain-containing protein [Gallionellaceae bacterium]|nr:twin-arginine translocation signal domain-containing protein [Gallionellaceae bacterium]